MTIQKYISHQQNGQGIGVLEGHAGMTILQKNELEKAWRMGLQAFLTFLDPYYQMPQSRSGLGILLGFVPL